MADRLPVSETRLRSRIARNVRRLRAERGVSAIDASEKVEMHWRLWQKLEAGDTNVTLRTLVRVATALGVDPRDLLA